MQFVNLDVVNIPNALSFQIAFRFAQENNSGWSLFNFRCSQVKKYILESYDVKIPEKAKVLLLTLTGKIRYTKWVMLLGKLLS